MEQNDEHTHQTDKSLSDNIKDTLHNDIIHHVVRWNQIVDDHTGQSSCKKRNKDHRGKAYLFLLLNSILHDIIPSLPDILSGNPASLGNHKSEPCS